VQSATRPFLRPLLFKRRRCRKARADRAARMRDSRPLNTYRHRPPPGRAHSDPPDSVFRRSIHYAAASRLSRASLEYWIVLVDPTMTVRTMTVESCLPIESDTCDAHSGVSVIAVPSSLLARLR